MKWNKSKGGMVPGETKPPQRTLREHEKRWNDVIVNWEKKEPWKMFFKVTEIINKFNRGAVKNGFHRVKLTDGCPTFHLQGFTYILSI